MKMRSTKPQTEKHVIRTTNGDATRFDSAYDTAERARVAAAFRAHRSTLGLLRQAVGKTQREVAAAAGMEPQTLSALEKLTSLDSSDVAILRDYARALGGELEVAVVLRNTRYIIA